VAPSPHSPPALLVHGVSKAFRLPHERSHTLKERALHPFRRSSFDRFDALNDVSFAVQPGEFFGIVGRNGSGKSTLLKCMAGIYRADAGRIYVNGRLSTFIELGVGFNPDLAARDNIAINAIMLGLSPREARVASSAERELRVEQLIGHHDPFADLARVIGRQEKRGERDRAQAQASAAPAFVASRHAAHASRGSCAENLRCRVRSA